MAFLFCELARTLELAYVSFLQFFLFYPNYCPPSSEVLRLPLGLEADFFSAVFFTVLLLISSFLCRRFLYRYLFLFYRNFFLCSFFFGCRFLACCFLCSWTLLVYSFRHFFSSTVSAAGFSSVISSTSTSVFSLVFQFSLLFLPLVFLRVPAFLFASFCLGYLFGVCRRG